MNHRVALATTVSCVEFFYCRLSTTCCLRFGKHASEEKPKIQLNFNLLHTIFVIVFARVPLTPPINNQDHSERSTVALQASTLRHLSSILRKMLGFCSASADSERIDDRRGILRADTEQNSRGRSAWVRATPCVSFNTEDSLATSGSHLATGLQAALFFLETVPHHYKWYSSCITRHDETMHA
jgi:hypothetical protein